jgi:hypothetical protein
MLFYELFVSTNKLLQFVVAIKTSKASCACESKLTNLNPIPKGYLLLPELNDCLDHFNEQYSVLLGKEESKKLLPGGK